MLTVYAIFFCLAHKPTCININQHQFDSKEECIGVMRIAADARPTFVVNGRLYVRGQKRSLWYECVRLRVAPWQEIGPISSSHPWAH